MFHRGHVKEKKLDDDTIVYNCKTRMEQQGYTKEEVLLFKRACRRHDESLFNQISCHCNVLPDGGQCEVCHLKEHERMYNPYGVNKL